MTVPRLLNLFQSYRVPVDVAEVRDQIVEWGFHEHIDIWPFVSDNDILYGVLLQYEEVRSYGMTVSHCTVRFSRRAEPAMQRLICVKELVHAMEPPSLHVATRGQMEASLDTLLAPIRHLDELDNLPLTAGEPTRIADPARNDAYAVLQALAILSPEDRREELAAAHHAGDAAAGLAEIAAAFDIPAAYAVCLVHRNWQRYRAALRYRAT